MIPKIDDLIELTIDNLGTHGEGVGKHNGFTVFVEGALPQEKVQVCITLVKPNYSKGKLLSILESSPHRAQPPCPLFGRCGGCQVQHLSYEQQLVMKQQRVIDALTRIGHFENIEVAPCIASPQELAYHNKIQLPVVGKQRSIQIGLYMHRSHHVIDVDHCYIHCDLGEKIFSDLKERLVASSVVPYSEKNGKGELRHVLIKSAIHTKEVLIIFVTNGPVSDPLKQVAEEMVEHHSEVKGVVQNTHTGSDNVILGKHFLPLTGQPYITETLSDLTFTISPASFFQVNTLQAKSLYAKALEFADFNGEETVLDAYCGIGTLSLLIAQQAKKVIGIESVPQAIKDANANAQQNGIANTEFICGSTEKAISSMQDIDTVFLNPPRKGCHPDVLQAIQSLRPKKVVYVSCDPATLARDLKLLCQDHYNISSVQPFDMFPQTTHVETVIALEARPGASAAA